MLKPLIIATPRTGSSVFCYHLFQLAKKNWGFESSLAEFFLQTWVEETNGEIKYSPPYYYVLENNSVIHRRKNDEFKDDSIATSSREQKLHLLSQCRDVHLIKIIAHQISDVALEFFKNRNFTPFYLHRRNKLEQFLSFSACKNHKKWQFRKDDPPVTGIWYERENFELFLENLVRFDDIRKNKFITGFDIYYEDFINAGADQAAILSLTGLTADIDHQAEKYQYAMSKYSDKIENLIVNKEDWNKDREEIIGILYKYDFQKCEVNNTLCK